MRHFDSDKCCRICLSTENVNTDIFENLPHRTPLCNRIYSALSIKLCVDDGLPTRLCIQCVSHINWIESFKHQCSETQSLLQMYRRFSGTTQNPETDEKLQKIEQFIFKVKEQRASHKNLLTHPDQPVNQRGFLYSEPDVIERTVTSDKPHVVRNEESTNALADSTHADTVVTVETGTSTMIEHCYAAQSAVTAVRLTTETDAPSHEEYESTENDEDEPLQNVTNSCQFCLTNFKSEQELQSHVRSAHSGILEEGALVSGSRYSCSFCERSYSRLSALNDHLETHDGRIYECPECKQVFKMKQYLLKHLMVHENARSKYKCRICDRRFLSAFFLNKHTRAHLGLKPYQCEKCGKFFSRSSLLTSHMDWHKGSKSYLCEMCGKMISSKPNLNAHINLHTNKERVYKCSKCDKKFIRKHHLHNHELTHSNERPFQCAACGTTFRRQYQLKEHEMIHSGEKNHNCEDCGKSFTTRRVLLVHQVVHSGVKAHQCSICTKTFSRRNGLLSHMYTHNTVKEFRCDVCGQEFSHRSSLSTHRKIHNSGKRPV